LERASLIKQAANKRKPMNAYSLFVNLLSISACAMLIPAFYGVSERDLPAARGFLQAGLIVGVLATLIGLATRGQSSRADARAQLATLVAAFTLLPAFLALPFMQVSGAGFVQSYVEMVSSVTTTGATLFGPFELSGSLHLWRATVGWMGGFFLWVAAAAILAPLNLGGFEVIATAGGGRLASDSSQSIEGPAQTTIVLGDKEDSGARIARIAGRLAPIYGGATAVLYLLQTMAGERFLVAVIHAMSTMSTSGISPVGGVQFGTGGRVAEAAVFLFFIFAISRVTFSAEDRGDRWQKLRYDPEARLGLLFVGTVTTLLLMRHFIGSFEEAGVESSLWQVFRAFWGSVFTVTSFLTTAGFVSIDWVAVRAWSGLETPGLILMGLALMGGGVATTAGGVKLLRVFALSKHGRREMERLVHPSSIGGAGDKARRIRRQGAFVAWVFFMLFALSLAGVGLALAASGIPFQEAVVLSVMSLATCGPLADVALEMPIDIGALETSSQAVLAMAMALGRLETLALIALLNPGFWRR